MKDEDKDNFGAIFFTTDKDGRMWGEDGKEILPPPTPPMKRKEGGLKGDKERYFECERCGDSLTSTTNIPCPRGSCEAFHVGNIIISKSLKKLEP